MAVLSLCLVTQAREGCAHISTGVLPCQSQASTNCHQYQIRAPIAVKAVNISVYFHYDSEDVGWNKPVCSLCNSPHWFLVPPSMWNAILSTNTGIKGPRTVFLHWSCISNTTNWVNYPWCGDFKSQEMEALTEPWSLSTKLGLSFFASS